MQKLYQLFYEINTFKLQNRLTSKTKTSFRWTDI